MPRPFRLVPPLVLALAALAAPPAHAADEPKIPLELFAKAEATSPTGCAVTLWQASRDPDKDRYAIVFHEVLKDDKGAREPARMEIGGKVLRLQRGMIGGAKRDFDLWDNQVYRADETLVVLELKPGPTASRQVPIPSGSLTVIQPGRLPFTAAVKGTAGCAAPPAAAAAPAAPARTAAAPPPLPSEDINDLFKRYKVSPRDVPAALYAMLEKKLECRPELMKTGITGIQLSEESAYWDVACLDSPYQVAHVLLLVNITDPKSHFELVELPGAPDRPRDDPHLVIDPEWDLKGRRMISFARGRGLADCGTHEIFKYAAGAFELAELREKAECDEQVIPPTRFPLVFPKKR